MYTYYYRTEQFLPIDINKAWDFFSSAKNLALITPPELDFKILTSLDEKAVYEGMLIEYRVKPLFHISMYWQTEICKVAYPSYFTDRQLKGPYKLWEHTHTFISKVEGVLMKDEVKYELPFGFIGKLMHSLIVRKKIEDIFIYRKNVLNEIFTNYGKVAH